MSLKEKEEKRGWTTFFLIISILLFAFLLLLSLLQILSSQNPIGSAMENQKLHNITPSISGYNKENNSIEIIFTNKGDPIKLTGEGKSHDDSCVNPDIITKKGYNGENIDDSHPIAENESFTIIWDCENSVEEKDLFSGELSFEYLREGEKNTYKGSFHARSSNF